MIGGICFFVLSGGELASVRRQAEGDEYLMLFSRSRLQMFPSREGGLHFLVFFILIPQIPGVAENYFYSKSNVAFLVTGSSYASSMSALNFLNSNRGRPVSRKTFRCIDFQNLYFILFNLDQGALHCISQYKFEKSPDHHPGLVSVCQSVIFLFRSEFSGKRNAVLSAAAVCCVLTCLIRDQSQLC